MKWFARLCAFLYHVRPRVIWVRSVERFFIYCQLKFTLQRTRRKINITNPNYWQTNCLKVIPQCCTAHKNRVIRRTSANAFPEHRIVFQSMDELNRYNYLLFLREHGHLYVCGQIYFLKTLPIFVQIRYIPYSLLQ